MKSCRIPTHADTVKAKTAARYDCFNLAVNLYKKNADLKIANESQFSEVLSELDSGWFDDWSIEK